MANGNLPVLERDRLDYTDGSYEVTVTRSQTGQGMAVRHIVSGSNLVSQMLKRSQAGFATEVSSPYATYRQIRTQTAGKVELTQEVDWQLENVVPPVYVRPLVIATVSNVTTLKLSSSHGVHEIWRDRKVTIAPGTILAMDRFWRASSTWESLLRIVPDEALPAGVYKVEASTGEGYHFRVKANPALYDRIVNPGSQINHRNSILTGCLARGFDILRADFKGGDGWREYPVLQALHAKLIENGLPTWDDPDFRADVVATHLRPIVFDAEDDE